MHTHTNAEAKVQIENTWNDRAIQSQRIFTPQRPWYKYADILLKSIQIQGPAVDIGCGVGEFLGVLKKHNVSAIGCDGNEQQVTQVRSMGFQVELVDLEKQLPFSDGTFGFASCLEVIEHVARAEFLLREIHRTLSPGGYLLISTPNFSFWQYRLKYLLGTPPVNEGIHVRFFNSKLLRRKVEDAGFQIVKSSGFTPLTGVNKLRGMMSLDIVTTPVPLFLENPLAAGLVILAKKTDRSSSR